MILNRKKLQGSFKVIKFFLNFANAEHRRER